MACASVAELSDCRFVLLALVGPSEDATGRTAIARAASSAAAGLLRFTAQPGLYSCNPTLWPWAHMLRAPQYARQRRRLQAVRQQAS